MLALFLFLPPKQDQYNWILLVGVSVSFSQYDVIDGVSMGIP